MDCERKDTINNYEILKQIGRGGFATVYGGRCRRTGRSVAIKMIDKKKLMQRMKLSDMIARVTTEIEIQSRLDHPSIVKLYAFFEDDDNVYLVLELCEKGDLKRYLKSKGKLTEDRARKILRQVIEGLMYLHSHNIIHRDLSLSNLLLTSDMKIKIADFGLAIKPDVDEEHHTICGTPHYISPEVASGDDYGRESDIWSLGALAYSLLVGRPPFEGDGKRETLGKVRKGEFEIPSYLSENSRHFISSVLKKDPCERMKLHDLLKHPFMDGHISLVPHLSPVLRMPLKPINTVTTPVSVDSGNGTMNSTSTQTSVATQRRKGPLRAIAIPEALCHLSAQGSEGKTHRAREKKRHGYSLSQRQRPLSSLSPPPSNPVLPSSLAHRRTMSMGESSFMPSAATTTNCRGSSQECSDTAITCSSTKDTLIPSEGIKPLAISASQPLLPLNAIRLCPIQYQTRSLAYSITARASVCLKSLRPSTRDKSGDNLPDEPSLAREGTISEIMEISTNGMEVTIYRPVKSNKVLKQPLDYDGFYRHASYSYHNLPDRYRKKYKLASRFVQLVQSKTIKVKLYTDQAKCKLMESGDLEACFYDGTRLHHSKGGQVTIDFQGKKHTYDSPDSSMPEELASLFHYAMTNFQTCKELECAISDISPGGNNFPATFRRKPDQTCLQDRLVQEESCPVSSTASTRMSTNQLLPTTATSSILDNISLPTATLSTYSRTSPSPVGPEALRTYSSSLMTSHEFLPSVPSHTAHSPVELSHDITLSATSFTSRHSLTDSPSTMAAHCSCPELCSHLNPHPMASQDSLPTRLSNETLLSISSLPYISTSQSLGPARSSHYSSSLSQENVPPSSPLLLHSPYLSLGQHCASTGANTVPSLSAGPAERMDDHTLLKSDWPEGPRILKKVHIPGTGWTLQFRDMVQVIYSSGEKMNVKVDLRGEVVTFIDRSGQQTIYRNIDYIPEHVSKKIQQYHNDIKHRLLPSCPRNSPDCRD